jgi:hypothetical protein
MLKTMEQPARQAQHRRARIVVPSRGDPLLRRMTEVVGGPLGHHTAPGIVRTGFFTVERVLLIMVLLSGLVAVLFKFHCRQAGWSTPDQYSTTCWSEIPNTFRDRGLAAFFPYSGATGFDYPPLTGFIAGLTAWLTGAAGTGSPRLLAYFDVNSVLIIAVWMVAVVATARTLRRRPWDAALIAVSPVLLFTALTSWDIWAAALVAVALLLFSRGKTFTAGAVLGLAASVQPYTLLVLLAILLVALRSGRMLPFVETLGAAVVGWLLVNLPVAVLNPMGWAGYWDDGLGNQATTSSIYGAYNLIAERLGLRMLGPAGADVGQLVLFLLAVVAVAWLVFAAPRRPRLGQLAFLLVAAYSVTDKHAAPQHVVWLLPLLALARPRWTSALLWQAAQILQFLALLLFLGRQLGDGNAQHAIDMPYFVLAVALQILATLALMGLVVREVLHPEYDVVRRAGADDPLAGVFGSAVAGFERTAGFRNGRARVALEPNGPTTAQGDPPR